MTNNNTATNTAKLLVILRGISGSGKSTLSKQIIEDFKKKQSSESGEQNPECVIYSTDDFFYVGNKYVFDGKKIGEAHEW